MTTVARRRLAAAAILLLPAAGVVAWWALRPAPPFVPVAYYANEPASGALVAGALAEARLSCTTACSAVCTLLAREDEAPAVQAQLRRLASEGRLPPMTFAVLGAGARGR